MKKSKVDAEQYALLQSCSQAEDFKPWNEWYAVHLKDMKYLRSSDAYDPHLEGGDLACWFLEGADLSYANLAGANLWRPYRSCYLLDGSNPNAAVYYGAGKSSVILNRSPV